MTVCPSWLGYTPRPKAASGGKGLLLYLTGEARAGVQTGKGLGSGGVGVGGGLGGWGQKLKQKSRRNPAPWLAQCSAFFFVQPKTTCPRVALPTVPWAFPHQS